VRTETGALALALGIAGCNSGEGTAYERTASSTSPIQGGTADTTDDFVVAVVAQGSAHGFAECSGSLIAPNLVATARHCVASVTSRAVDCSITAFGSVAAVNTIAVTTDPDLSTATQFYGVAQVIVPSGAGETSFCGNDLALLLLNQSIVLPKYVTPIIDPPMTDHSAYSTTITAIGYGITSPTDTTGQSAGIRRIRENIDLACIPNDKTIFNCLEDPSQAEFLSAKEFEASGGTCEGDSGSGAFEQRSFDAGNWMSFGVLSRGGTDADSAMCVSAVYTRFDAWGSLLANTAAEAAQLGQYPTPAWAVAAGAEAGVPAAASPAAASPVASGAHPDAASCLPVAAACGSDVDCCSVNCLSHDGTTYLCARCNDDDTCNGGYECANGTCTPSDASVSPSVGGTSATTNGGCSAAPNSLHARGRGTGRWLTGFAAVLVIGGRLRRGLPRRALRGFGRNRIPRFGNAGAIKARIRCGRRSLRVQGARRRSNVRTGGIECTYRR
jgi:V8-like Glu-specific endopeptidase